jgi:pimeloyl-ACP methyl ester carboxylesterase
MRRPFSATFAYCHGFLSSPASSKGRFLAAEFASRGAHLHLLDLNRGDGGPESLCHQGALEAIDEHWHSSNLRPLRLVGSSFGGWAAAAYAARYPERVERLVLLCPGFSLHKRWESIVGGALEMDAWQRDGVRPFTGACAREEHRYAPAALGHTWYPRTLSSFFINKMLCASCACVCPFVSRPPISSKHGSGCKYLMGARGVVEAI